PKVKPVPTPVYPCDECCWESPCESEQDEPCEWRPCPEWCPPPALQPPKVRQIWDGQIQAQCPPHGVCPFPPLPLPPSPPPPSPPSLCYPPGPCPPPPPKVTQIWDGQIQAPCHPHGLCPLPP